MTKTASNLFRKLICYAVIVGSPLWPVYTQEVFKNNDDVFSTRAIEISKAMKSSQRLEILSAESVSGNLEIEVSDDGLITVKYFKQSNAKSRSDAYDFIDQMSASLTNSSSGARLNLRAPNPAPWGKGNQVAVIHARIMVPANIHVEIEARYFDVTASGPFASFAVKSSFGRLNVSDVNGRLDLETTNRRITVERIHGAIEIETSNATIEANDIEAVGRRADFRNENGDIRIDGFDGEINIKSNYGRIQLTAFNPSGRKNFIRGRSAPILLEITKMSDGQVVVTNVLEDIEILVPENLSANYSLAVSEGGRIEASDIVFATKLVEHNRLNLTSGKGKVHVRGSIRGKGNIYLRGNDVGK